MGDNIVPEAKPPTARLPSDLRQRVLSLLPTSDAIFGLKFSCKEESLCYREAVYRTAPFSQPLPSHVVDTAWCVEGAQAAMKQLTFRQKLTILSTAAASGCEANVEFALRLLQPHVFPELLRTDHYQTQMLKGYCSDLGSAAVLSGLAHLLPSLAQHCPGLLDPGRTLEAAARHCDLAGLQAAWEAVGQQLLTVLKETEPDVDRIGYPSEEDDWDWEDGVDPKQWVWRDMMMAVAMTPAGDALAKMEWILENHTGSCITVKHPLVCGAAAGSGDMARLAWLRDRGFPWGTAKALAAVMRYADLGFIQRLEQGGGGYLPPAEDAGAWTSDLVLCEAAAWAKDSVAKLRWLAGRGAALGNRKVLHAAAALGNLEAVQLLAGQQGQGLAEGGGGAGMSSAILRYAVESGSIPVAAWLRQAGYPWCYRHPLGDSCYGRAFRRGDLAMVRWLLEAGCPRGRIDSLSRVVETWPCYKPVDSGRLVEALRLLAAAGWPAGLACHAVAVQRHPSSVLVALRELLPAAAQDVPDRVSLGAAACGCEATLEALVGAELGERQSGKVGAGMYAAAARNGDRAAMECLLRLGVPLGEGVLAEAVRQGAPVPALQWLVAHGAPRGGGEVVPRWLQGWRRDEVAAWLLELPEP